MGSGTLVLGIGNLLWADEGFGVRCVEALQAGWDARRIDIEDLGWNGARFVDLDDAPFVLAQEVVKPREAVELAPVGAGDLRLP